MENALALVPITNKETVVEIFFSDGIQDKITAIEEDAKNYVADIKTDAGRKACKSKAASIAKQKVVVENAKKDLKADVLATGKKIDAVWNRIKERMDAARDLVRKPLTEYEEEKARKDQEERDRIQREIEEEDRKKKEELEARERAVAEKEAEFKRLEDERLAKEKAEQEEKERIEREARIAQEAKETAEREAKEAIERAEQEKKDAIAKAEKDKERAEMERQKVIAQAKDDRIKAAETADRLKKEAVVKAEREKQAAIQEERQRQEKIKADEAERKRIEKKKADQLAANLNHIRKYNREMLEDFAKIGVSTKLGTEIIKASVGKQIRHLTVNY